MSRVDWQQYQDVLTAWLATQPQQVNDALPKSRWRTVLREGAPGRDQLRFDPDLVVSRVFDGNEDLRASVAEPLCAHLNAVFGAGAGAPGEPAAPAPAEQATPQQWGTPAGAAYPATQQPAEFAAPQPAPIPAQPPAPEAFGAPAPASAFPLSVPGGMPGSRPDAPAAAPASFPGAGGADVAAGQFAAPGVAPGGPQPGEGQFVGGLGDSGAAQAGQGEWNYPDYDYTRWDPEPMGTVSIDRMRNSLRYRWSDAGENEVYRVVVERGGFSQEIESGRTVGWTRGLMIEDLVPMDSPCRFVTVWGYEDLGDGELGQCRRVAMGRQIAQVEGVQVAVDGTTVRAKWSVPGTEVGFTTGTSVLVGRLPADVNVGQAIQSMSWLREYLVEMNLHHNLAGIDDLSAQPGQSYVYLAAVQTVIDGQEEIGRPVKFEARLEHGPLAKPEGFRVVPYLSGDGNHCTLEWKPAPGTQVRVYLTTTESDASLFDEAEVPVELLARHGLPTDAEVPGNPVPCMGEDAADRVQLLNVPWRDGHEFDKLYFTPVAVRAGRAAVGKPVVVVRSGEITDARVIQRLEWHLITFAWPGDAAEVQLRDTNWQGVVPVSGLGAVDARMKCRRQEYEREGGFVIGEAIAPTGAQVQLNSVKYYDGELHYGEPVLLEVPPLLKFGYRINWPGTTQEARKKVLGRRKMVELAVWAELPGACPEGYLPQLTLVYNPDCLPLTSEHGYQLPLYATEKAAGNQAATVVQAPSQTASYYFSTEYLQRGYLRLMVHMAPEVAFKEAHNFAELRLQAAERFALIDPPADELTLG
ncbi:MAG: hypothetical protein Q3999_00830 [Buchananella hordeovulneris]|nr:hypothetical protein [Buchananella hordeovulneris]